MQSGVDVPVEALDPSNREAQRELFNALDSAVQIQLVGAKGQKKGDSSARGRLWVALVTTSTVAGLTTTKRATSGPQLTAIRWSRSRHLADKGQAVVGGLGDFVASVEALITEAATASPAKGKVRLPTNWTPPLAQPSP